MCGKYVRAWGYGVFAENGLETESEGHRASSRSYRVIFEKEQFGFLKGRHHPRSLLSNGLDRAGTQRPKTTKRPGKSLGEETGCVEDHAASPEWSLWRRSSELRMQQGEPPLARSTTNDAHRRSAGRDPRELPLPPQRPNTDE